MKSVEYMVESYEMMKRFAPNSGMLREVKWQYTDMAVGGDGGDLGFEENGESTCRGINYPGYPDSFFQKVCDRMGWKY
jgi:hypothetical protein